MLTPCGHIVHIGERFSTALGKKKKMVVYNLILVVLDFGRSIVLSD